MNMHVFPNGRHNPDQNTAAEIVTLANQVLNGGYVEYWNIFSQTWVRADYKPNHAPFDFNNTVYRLPHEGILLKDARALLTTD